MASSETCWDFVDGDSADGDSCKNPSIQTTVRSHILCHGDWFSQDVTCDTPDSCSIAPNLVWRFVVLHVMRLARQL